MTVKVVRVIVFAVGGVSMGLTSHWSNARASTLDQPWMLLGELAVFVGGCLTILGTMSLANSWAKRPGPRALPGSPSPRKVIA
jgi:hypothetical protein